MSPCGLVRVDSNNPETLGVCYRNGFDVTEPLEFGTSVELPLNFGTEIPVSDPTLNSNPVTWQIDPARFGNIVLLGSTPPPSGVQLIAHTGATNNSSFASTITTNPIDTTGSNFIVVSAASMDFGVGTVSLSDNLGNTWHEAETQTGSRGVNRLYYAFNASVGVGQTFTVSDSSGSADCAIAVAAFSGMTATDPFETGFVGGFTTAQTIQGTALTAATAGDLIVQAFMAAGQSGSATVSINEGFTIPDQDGIGNTSENANAALAFVITDSLVPVNPTWTWSNSLGASIGIVGSAFAAME